MQRWPVVPKPPQMAPSTARSRLASSITMMMFLPPISRWHFLNVGAQAMLTMRPTSVEPVKLTRLHVRMLEDRRADFAALRRHHVHHAARQSRFREYLHQVVGGKRRVFRRLDHHRVAADSAGMIFHDGMAMGKFQGVISPATPIGVRTDIANLLGSSDGVVWPNSRRPSPAIR